MPGNHAFAEDEPESVAMRRRLCSQWRNIGTWQTEGEWRRLRWAYARITEKVDRQIDRLLDGRNTATNSSGIVNSCANGTEKPKTTLAATTPVPKFPS